MNAPHQSVDRKRENRPENQHFVSAGYLRNFVPAEERALHVYRRGGTRWFREVPENLGTKRNLYSFTKPDGSYEDLIEKILGKYVESPGLRSLNHLINVTERLSAPDRSRVSFLLAVQAVRVPGALERYDAILHESLSFVADEFFENTETLQKAVEEVEKLDSVGSHKRALEIRKLWRSGSVMIRPHEKAALSVMFEPCAEATEIFFRMRWRVFRSSNSVFLTSDAPVYFSPFRIPHGETVGFGTENAVLNVPLSSRAFLVMENPNYCPDQLSQLASIAGGNFADAQAELPPPIEFLTATEAQSNAFNAETCRCATQWVCGAEPLMLAEAELQKPQLGVEFEVTRTGTTLHPRSKMISKPI